MSTSTQPSGDQDRNEKSTEQDSFVEPPCKIQLQPSTESYLNPCKELLESVGAIQTTKVSPKRSSLNPFETSDEDSPCEESDEDPVTVVHSTPCGTPIKQMKKSESTNPFDEDDDEN